MADLPPSRATAQRRADRVAAFRAELDELEREGVLALAEDDRRRVHAHHQELLAGFAGRLGVDVGEGARQLSLGMRVASLVGALALAASLYYAVYQVWGEIPTWLQVAILVAAPLLGVGLTHLAAARERTGYFAALAGLFALAACVLGVVALGELFNQVSSPHPFLAWGVLGLLLGAPHGLRLLVGLGLGSLALWSAAAPIWWAGHPWPAAFERPETFLPAALVLLGLATLPRFARHEQGAALRLVGGVILILALITLGWSGDTSWLPLEADVVEPLYQVLAFAAAAGLVTLGIRRGWRDLVHVGTASFVVLLWIKFVDWWWEWMPKSLFFLIVGATAVAALLVLHRLRRAAAERETA
jgi:uncharacterized membrane protein